ncbi:MAG: hypothetical protein Q9191_000957 [Dirinaria sp. TL-2023a]
MPPTLSQPHASTHHYRQPASGTPTQTQTEARAPSQPRIAVPAGTLRLRATAANEDRRIQWAEDVIDNEGLGRKRSKVGESSSESSSDSSSSESDSELDDRGGDDDRAKMGGKGREKRKDNGHDHDGEDGCRSHGSKSKGRRQNAYEVQPKPKGGGVEGLKS